MTPLDCFLCICKRVYYPPLPVDPAAHRLAHALALLAVPLAPPRRGYNGLGLLGVCWFSLSFLVPGDPGGGGVTVA